AGRRDVLGHELDGLAGAGARGEEGGVDLAAIDVGGEDVLVLLGVSAAEQPFERSLAEADLCRDDDPALLAFRLEAEVLGGLLPQGGGRGGGGAGRQGRRGQ